MQIAPRALPKLLTRLKANGGAAVTARSTRTLATTNGNSPTPPAPNVREIAELAQLEVTEEEVKDWEPKIRDIVDWFGELRQIDVSDVPPQLRACSSGNRLRADAPIAFENREALMALAPEKEGPYVKCPKIATGADTAGETSKPVSEELPPVSVLDIRVGKIVDVQKHPDADALYVEKIDVGDDEPRTIVSGLVKYVPIEELQDRSVIILCNLKPRNMRGIKSHGMMLCASDESHENVEPLTPPSNAMAGERVYFGDEKDQDDPEVPNKVQKKKMWEALQPKFLTGEDGVATFGGMVMSTAAGAIKAPTLAKATIS